MKNNVQNEALLQQWMQTYGSDVLRTCFVYLGDRALAEDAAQDTFIKVWRSMNQFSRKGNASPKTWITRIAINTCKDYRRSAWFRHIDLSQTIDTLPPSVSPSDEEERALMLDVMRLPDRYKQAVLLYYIHDMTMEEAAQALGISRASMHNRLQKAYELLGRPEKGGTLHAQNG